VSAHVYDLVQMLCIEELKRPPRSTRIFRIREMAESLSFQIFVLECVLDYFESHPTLPAKYSHDIVRNLAQFYKNIEHIDMCLTIDSLVRLLNHIHNLAYQNTSEVRARMKSVGMFELRYNLVVHLLRDGVTGKRDIGRFLELFQFDSIAGQPKFRDSYGFLYLLHLMHLESSSHAMRSAIHQIMVHSFGLPYEENRKIISRILGSTSVSERFFASTPDGATSFIDWYEASEQAEIRAATQKRIAKCILVAESKGKNTRDKAAARRNRKIKERKEALAKASALRNRARADFEQKRKSKLAEYIAEDVERRKAARVARGNRELEGKRIAEFLCPTLLLQIDGVSSKSPRGVHDQTMHSPTSGSSIS